MDQARDYQLAEHLIKHLQQDADLADMVCPTVWDERDQVDALNLVAINQPGIIAVTPAGYVPLLDIQSGAPLVRMQAVLGVSCFCRASAAGLPGGNPTLRQLSGMVSGVLRAGRLWDPVVDRVCYDQPAVAAVEDYDLAKSKLEGYRGRAVILYAPINF